MKHLKVVPQVGRGVILVISVGFSWEKSYTQKAINQGNYEFWGVIKVER